MTETDLWEDLEKLAIKTFLLEFEESTIDKSLPLVLITWSPSRENMPDTDFVMKHRSNVNFLSDFLKCTSCGAFCVEANEMGQPHYHGFYQHTQDSKTELALIAFLDTMYKTGNLKVTKEVFKYKKFSWSKKANALWYYKKELLTSQFHTPHNPIVSQSYDETPWDTIAFFMPGPNVRMISTAVSERRQLLDFYKYSS